MKNIKQPIAVIPELAEGSLAEVKIVATIALVAELVEAVEVRLLSLAEVKKLEELLR